MNMRTPIISYLSTSEGSIIRIRGPRQLWASAAALDLHSIFPYFSLLFPDYKMQVDFN